MIRIKILFFVIFVAVFGVFSVVGAQESISQELDDIEVEEVTEVPSDLSLWWKNITETVSLWLTFDPVERAEKMIQFAEERVQIAELMSESDQVKLQEKSRQMIEVANRYMEKIEAGKDKWSEKIEENVNRLRKNIATHQIRREDFVDVIEENLSEDQLEKLQDIRERGLENSSRLINAINNENLPEDVRSYLESVQSRIQSHLDEVKEYNQERQQIREQIQSGNEGAVEELEQLRKQRREQIRERLINGEEVI